jgi:uncharacterized protein
MSTHDRTITLVTEDGEQLEADLASPPDPIAGIVIAHPHPLRGGNRFSPVVEALFSRFSQAGWATLRYDFRGVGASTGTHGDGVAERLDVKAAIDALRTEYPTLGIFSAGYSFGSRVALTVSDPCLLGWIAVAPPLAVGGPSAERDAIGADSRPKLLVVPEADNFSPPAATAPIVNGWSNTATVVIRQADHFFNHDSVLVSSAIDEALLFAERLATKA